LSKQTRSANGSGTIRKRADGRWEGIYSAGYDQQTGKLIRKSIYGKNQKEVRQKLSKVTTEIDEGLYLEPAKMTLSDWMDLWYKEYTFDKKYSTLKGYKAQINKHIRPGIGKYNLSQLNPMILQRFFNHLSEPNEKGKVLSPKSIKNVYIILSGILEQAVENEMISKNPCKKVKLPKVYSKQITPLTDKQVKDFLEIISTDEIYGTILRVIVFTGLRLGEAMGLTWDCVDFEKGALNINKQLQRRPQKDGGSTLTSVKSGKPRILKPAPFVMQLLKIRYTEQIMQKQRSEDLWLAWSNEEEHKKALVFTNLQGGYLIPKRVYLHFKSAAVAIGAPDARVHDLRHTYAVLSLQNGDDIKTVQENLGHASAAFTLDVYGHVSDRMKKESANRMEEYIRNLNASGS
jgi:integrase